MLNAAVAAPKASAAGESSAISAQQILRSEELHIHRRAGSLPLMPIGAIARFARNETIFNEGDEARYCYRVIGGAVRLSKVMLDGRRQIADFLLPPDLFAVDCGSVYSVTAEALSDTVLTRYSRAQFERLFDSVPEIRHEIMMALRRELGAAQSHLLMLGRQTAKERLASFLLLLADRRKGEVRDRVDLPMSRQDIADYLGLTIETVCRTFAELRRLNIVSIPGRNAAIIRNPGALRAIATGAG